MPRPTLRSRRWKQRTEGWITGLLVAGRPGANTRIRTTLFARLRAPTAWCWIIWPRSAGPFATASVRLSAAHVDPRSLVRATLRRCALGLDLGHTTCRTRTRRWCVRTRAMGRAGLVLLNRRPPRRSSLRSLSPAPCPPTYTANSCSITWNGPIYSLVALRPPAQLVSLPPFSVRRGAARTAPARRIRRMVATLHQRAARWFEAHRNLDRCDRACARRQAVAACGTTHQQIGSALLQSGATTRLQEMIEALPSTVCSAQPRLA